MPNGLQPYIGTTFSRVPFFLLLQAMLMKGLRRNDDA
jgi:hypothetical protein